MDVRTIKSSISSQLTIGFVFILLLVATSPSLAQPSKAINFSTYCTDNTGDQDCSQAFLDALYVADREDKSIIFEGGNVFNINSVSTASLGFSNIRLIGVEVEGVKPKLVTNKLHLLDINGLYIDGLSVFGRNNDEGDGLQGTTVTFIGTKDESNKMSNITIVNSHFEDSAEDLVVIWNAKNVRVSNNVFKRSGLALRIGPIITPGDYRPRGSGLLFHNIQDTVVSKNEFYETKRTSIFFDAKDIVSSDIQVINNYIDMLSYEKPTHRYGLKGGAGIYVGNSPNFSNIRIQGNTILNFKMNAIRLNGEHLIVKDNAINYQGHCNTMDKSISEPDVGIGIKAHYIKYAEITNNCFQNTSAAISIESWAHAEFININKNTVYDADNAIFVTYSGDNTYSNVTVDRNELYRTKTYGIAFFSKHTSSGNKITGNTLVSSEEPLGGPLIKLHNQDSFYYDNNWIKAQARSINWNFMIMDKVTDSVFKRSTFKSYSGADKSFGGIYIRDQASTNNVFENITFTGLEPGIHDLGSGNTFNGITLN